MVGVVNGIWIVCGMVQHDVGFWGGGGWCEVVGVFGNTWVIFEMVGTEVQAIVAVGTSHVIVKWWVSLRHLTGLRV